MRRKWKRGNTRAQDAAVTDVYERMQAALNLVDSQTADEIIGDQPQEEAVLINGVQAALELLWAMLKCYGLKHRRKPLLATGRTIVIIAQIVHYAYALGIRRGRTEAEGARQ